MPIMTGVQGYTSLTQQVRLCLETSATPGDQLLMPLTTGASTMSLTTQPNTISPTTGMHLHFFVLGNATAGTISIVGTNASGGAQTSITYHVPIAPQNQQGYTDFTTSEIWGTVTASSITLTNLTPCQVMVWGSFGGKYLAPLTSDAEEKIPRFSPNDHRGILFKNFRVTQLAKSADVGQLDCALYPDSLWAPYMLFGKVPTVTTVPAAPTSKLAATTVAATMTLTTGPASPGEFLIFTPSGNSATGTIVLSGTDNYGNAVSETIKVGANNNPVYSTKRYSALTSPGSNQFTTTGITGTATLAVTGVFAWQYEWTYDGINNYTPYSASLESFDGVEGVVLPGTILSEGNWDWQKEKEIAFTSKGTAQDYCIVGDPNPTSTANYLSGTNPFPTIAQPTSMPVVSWPASFYIDALPGTPFTTQDGSMLTFKFGYTTGLMWKFTGDAQQRPSFVTWDSEPDYSIEATMIFQNYAYYLPYFKKGLKLALGTFFQGNFLGKDASNIYYEGVKITAPCKVDTYKPDRSKNPVEGALKVISEYDFTLGYAFKYAVISQTPPTYTA